MNIIKTTFFINQVNKLIKHFPKLSYDLDNFEKNIKIEPFSNLGNNVYKFRLRNSSIPVGKRSGFRIIILILNNTYIPLIIYSKNLKSNISNIEITKAKEKILSEL